MKLAFALVFAALAAAQSLPDFSYGAVYFRKSNPPREDWERDYAQAAKDGMNTFRHWFLWGAIEVAPGEFDWADYDAQLDLAAKFGIKTVAAEIVHSAPEWAFHRYPHAQFLGADGRRPSSQMRNSSVTGGFPGLCLDNHDYRERAALFLAALARRYRNHPAMGAYDIWNECNLNSSGFLACYCPATAQAFRDWLRARYGPDVKTLGKAWNRFSYTSWEEVVPPRGAGPYPDYLDWTLFRIDNAYRHMKWRADIIRREDPHHPIATHGMYDKTLDLMAPHAIDAWRSAAHADIYGFTGISANEDRDEKNVTRWSTVDLSRAAARGKRFWAAETSGGPSWVQRKGSREGGRIPTPEDIRLANFIMMAGGATGIFSPRWRPLLDGPLFGAYGFYGMDGLPTPNSGMASTIARWAASPQTANLWKSRPVKGGIGIVVVPEAEIYASLSNEEGGASYGDSARGAYAAFFHSGIQADYVHIDDIAAYRLLYLPYPLLLNPQTAAALTKWVQAGGRLVSEACPGYFTPPARAGVVQPNQGLDRVFGARQEYVEFAPDLLQSLSFRTEKQSGVTGAINLQAYRPLQGAAKGWFEDGRVALVENTYGKGKTLLIGTHPGAGYWRHPSPQSREFFAQLIDWAGSQPQLHSTGGVAARLHDGPGGTYLWIVNHKTVPAPFQVTLNPGSGVYRNAELLWGTQQPTLNGASLKGSVPPRDALVLRLNR